MELITGISIILATSCFLVFILWVAWKLNPPSHSFEENEEEVEWLIVRRHLAD